jgi:hypothetical protein
MWQHNSLLLFLDASPAVTHLPAAWHAQLAAAARGGCPGAVDGRGAAAEGAVGAGGVKAHVHRRQLATAESGAGAGQAAHMANRGETEGIGRRGSPM